MKKFLLLAIVFYLLPVLSQTDSINLKVIYTGNSSILQVEQTFNAAPNSDENYFYLYGWANAYKDKTTTLATTKLDSRDDQLHFAPIGSRGWIENLHFTNMQNEPIQYKQEGNELYKVSTSTVGNRVRLKATYDIHLPSNQFTDYGIDENGNLLLKYFFLQPAIVDNEKIVLQNFKDFESLSANNTHYELEIHVPQYYDIYTDLSKIGRNTYVGDNMEFFQIAIQFYNTTHTIDTNLGKVIFGFKLPKEDFIFLEPIVNKQLSFLRKFLGDINQPIFISRKSYHTNRIEGIQDIEIPIINKEYQIFDRDKRLELEMLTQLTFAYVDHKVQIDMRKDHWIRNGIKGYLAIRYVEKYHPELLLAGNIVEDLGVWDIYPLKIFEASKVKMSERTELLYRLFLSNNLDQSLDTPYDELSNLNQKNVSYFKSALGFQFIAAYLGVDEFDHLLEQMVKKYDGELIDHDKFKTYFTTHASKDVSWYFDEFVKHDTNLDFGIKRVKFTPSEDSLNIVIKNKSSHRIPIRISGYKDGERVYDDWVTVAEPQFTENIPNQDYDLLVLNDSIHFPDFNLKNNYYKPGSFLRRKLKFGLVTDLPSYKYEQIFVLPKFGWNNYDKLQIGLKLTNKTIIPSPWEFTLSPQYSTGENSLTGRMRTSYTFFPEHSWFRAIKFSLSTSYNHYNRGLAYKSYGFANSFTFSKPPRSLSRSSLHLSYQQVERDLALDATPEERELRNYKLLNIGFSYWDPSVIHERQSLVNLQISSKFSKAMGEFYWRWKFSKKKRLGVRVFAGMFINHKLSSSDYFDFGLDRITDYTFQYPLLGRSETEGLLSQQFVLAEGGFKSNFFVKVDQYLFTMNLEYPLWKMIDIYVDGGVYKNKRTPKEFVYDSGARVRVIPDFLELYFPIQSSLGFEPTLGAYHERIRFMLNLDLQKFISYWSRGKY